MPLQTTSYCIPLIFFFSFLYVEILLIFLTFLILSQAYIFLHLSDIIQFLLCFKRTHGAWSLELVGGGGLGSVGEH